MSKSRNIQFGMIGAGAIGTLHARNIASRVAGAELRAVMDIDLGAAENVAFSSAYATQDLGRLLDDPDIDAVLIASLTSLHAEHIEKSVQAGKAIFCEKPVAIDIEETRRIMALVEEKAVPFQIGFQRRFDPGYREVARRLHAGDRGRIEMFRSQSSDPKPAPEDYIAQPESVGVLGQHETARHGCARSQRRECGTHGEIAGASGRPGQCNRTWQRSLWRSIPDQTRRTHHAGDGDG